MIKERSVIFQFSRKFNNIIIVDHQINQHFKTIQINFDHIKSHQTFLFFHLMNFELFFDHYSPMTDHTIRFSHDFHIEFDVINVSVVFN